MTGRYDTGRGARGRPSPFDFQQWWLSRRECTASGRVRLVGAWSGPEGPPALRCATERAIMRSRCAHLRSDDPRHNLTKAVWAIQPSSPKPFFILCLRYRYLFVTFRHWKLEWPSRMPQAAMPAKAPLSSRSYRSHLAPIMCLSCCRVRRAHFWTFSYVENGNSLACLLG